VRAKVAWLAEVSSVEKNCLVTSRIIYAFLRSCNGEFVSSTISYLAFAGLSSTLASFVRYLLCDINNPVFPIFEVPFRFFPWRRVCQQRVFIFYKAPTLRLSRYEYFGVFESIGVADLA
jgi:hypothetical protein